MKNKAIKHPKYYKKIVDINNNYVIVEYIDNEFNDNQKRVSKRKKIHIDKTLTNISEFLNKLNVKELEKLNRFITIQNKAMNYHIKKENHDSYKIIKDSIALMNNFKKKYKN